MGQKNESYVCLFLPCRKHIVLLRSASLNVPTTGDVSKKIFYVVKVYYFARGKIVLNVLKKTFQDIPYTLRAFETRI